MSLIDSRYRAPWLIALPFAAAVILASIVSFGYWFGLADRYRVFLYFHDMGPLVPDTSPFSAVTASRYWMSALVWAGAVMVLYTGVNWLAGLVSSRYRPPAWWQVWLLCSLPLLVLIPLISMTANQPLLPAPLAGQVALAALAGLAFALAPGRMAADRPLDLLLLVPDGAALMLILTGALGIDRMEQLTSGSYGYFIGIVCISAAGGLALLIMLSGLRLWRQWPMPEQGELFVAAICVAYLLMPLLHHVVFTDGYYYISDADNFFARDLGLRLGIWLALILLVIGISWLRKTLRLRQLQRDQNPRQIAM